MSVDRSVLHRRLEQQERRLGMCSLDRAKIDHHFGRAKQLRAMADHAEGRLTLASAIGTKGSCPERIE